MTSKVRALVELNIATFLFGFVGFFGKSITLPSNEIVFWRSLLAAVPLYLVGRHLASRSRIRTWGDFLAFLAIAVLIALQTFFFFESVKVSTVAIALITVYTYPVAMVFLEGWFNKERIQFLDFISALLVVVGVSHITPELDPSSSIFKGVGLGLCAGLMVPVIILTRKKYLVGHYSSWDITTYEMGLVTCILLPFMLSGDRLFQIPDQRTVLLLLLLGLLSTGLARILLVRSQRALSGKLVGLILIFEVVYGIAIALVLLSEVPSQREIVGGLFVIAVVLFEALRYNRSKPSVTEAALKTP
jgi:drug/metabolite transporter (DMT)-like permease